MKLKGFIGPAYTLKSVNIDCQRCVNLYPEVNEIGTSKEGEVAHLLSTPGLVNRLELGDGPIRCIHEDSRGRIFVVSGNKLFKVTLADPTWLTEEVGEFETSIGIVRAASIKTTDENNFDGMTVFVDGSNNYLFWAYDGDTEDFDIFANFGYPPVLGATFVINLDGYFIYNKHGTDNFFASDWNSLSVDPLSFSSAEGDPDNIVAMIANYRDLWLFNEKSTEIFSNTGNPDFPFQRVQSGFIEIGCVAASSVAKIQGSVFWLGQDSSGHGIVYMASGLNPSRISTHAIELAIQSYEDISSAVAYTYQSGGHSFYVLNFNETTWVYDLKTGMWHERAFTNEGELERHRANCHAFIASSLLVNPKGLHLVGDYANNKVYSFDDDVYDDDGVEITRMRTTPHISAGLKSVFCNSLQVDMETGVGLDGSGLGSDPQVVMQFSNDGGHTWSSEAWASAGQKIGGIGQFKTRVLWRRLGIFRDRVFRITITDPVKVVLLNAEIDLEVGAS